MEEEQQLSKKKQRELKKQKEKEVKERQERNAHFIKWVSITGLVGLVILGFWWFIKESNKPLPGRAVADQGRGHVQDLSGITYNSNPPTSGKHFPVWAKRGVYKDVISDGHLVHSLEHGYVILSYNCDTKGNTHDSIKYHKDNPFAKEQIVASDAMSAFRPETAPKKIVDLPKGFSSENCKKLVSDLSSFLNDFERIIIVPRSSLDATIAVTTWDRIDKMDTFDKKRIQAFIEAFHNKGPEQTIE